MWLNLQTLLVWQVQLAVEENSLTKEQTANNKNQESFEKSSSRQMKDCSIMTPITYDSSSNSKIIFCFHRLTCDTDLFFCQILETRC